MVQRRAVDDEIAESTLALLRSGGPRAVTVEAVRAHSGIAKTTIYRRYRDRRDMLASALGRLIFPAPAALVDVDAAERLRWLIRHAVAAIGDGIGFGGFASLLTEEDPEFSALFRQVLVAHRATLVGVIDASKADGGMRADLDPETLIDAIVGAYVSERARSGGIGEDWADRLFALFWPLVRRP